MTRRVQGANLQAIDLDDFVVAQLTRRRECRVLAFSMSRTHAIQRRTGPLAQGSRTRRMIRVGVRCEHGIDASVGQLEESVDVALLLRAWIDDEKSLMANDIRVGPGTCHVTGVVGHEAPDAGADLIQLS